MNGHAEPLVFPQCQGGGLQNKVIDGDPLRGIPVLVDLTPQFHQLCHVHFDAGRHTGDLLMAGHHPPGNGPPHSTQRLTGAGRHGLLFVGSDRRQNIILPDFLADAGALEPRKVHAAVFRHGHCCGSRPNRRDALHIHAADLLVTAASVKGSQINSPLLCQGFRIRRGRDLIGSSGILPERRGTRGLLIGISPVIGGSLCMGGCISGLGTNFSRFPDISDRGQHGDRGAIWIQLLQQDTGRGGLRLHGDLVCFDLHDGLTHLHLIALLLQPGDNGSLSHVHAVFRHINFGQHSVPPWRTTRDYSVSRIAASIRSGVGNALASNWGLKGTGQ